MKKKFFAFFIILPLLAAGLFFAACDGEKGEDTPKENNVIVCLGDSLTAGFGATVPNVDDKTKSYPAFLQEKVKIPVINAGVSGNTTANALARLDSDVLSHSPKVVVIILGANDIFNEVNLAITEMNYKSIMNKIDNGKRKIYLAKFYTDAIALQLLVMYPDVDLDAYNAMYTTLASSPNVELIEDIWDGIWGIYMSDFVHPNATGYELMAGNIFKEMEPYLTSNGFVK